MINKSENMKKNCRREERSAKGITLVTLVITIIVMLILAGIVITLSIGDNGIINRAKNAAEKYKLASEEERKTLNNLYENIYLNNNKNPNINRDELESIIKGIVTETMEEERLKQYPVGSIYMSENDTNPKEFLGGEWKSYGEGRTIIGAGTGTDVNNISQTFTNKETGGEYKNTLTIEEMPSHIHSMPGHCAQILTADGPHGWWLRSISIETEYGESTQSTGGSKPHNNIQPYIVTYMWKRIE